MDDAPQVLTLADAEQWRALLPASRSVFGSAEFAALQGRHAGVEPRLLALRTPGGPIVHPLHLRPVADLGLPDPPREARFDAATPQYTGPIAPGTEGEIPEAERRAFTAALESWCAAEGIVTEFGHLHPWLARTELLAAAAAPRLDREIVYVDLGLDEQRMWRESYSRACRKNINRARREGVRVFEASSPEHARELHRIYEQTMERRGALDRYRLGAEYFASVLELLPDNARIVLAEHDGRVIAATLYLHDEGDAYSYLGGADHSFQSLRPTNAVVHEMIRWARERGIRRLILGGGYGPEDGILRFKGSFSPLRRPFYVYRRVHLAEAYDAMRERWRQAHGTPEAAGFFPPYRAAPAQRR